MNKFRVTCLLDSEDGKEPRRVFASLVRFTTREAAQSYADTVSPDRKPMVGYCQFFTNYDNGHWTIYDINEYDGMVGGDIYFAEGHKIDELDFIWEFVEETDRCTVFFDGVPCGGHPGSVYDEGGSGYMRCDKCGML